MKQKFNELLDKPWTTRGYLKLAGIVYVICMIFAGGLYLKCYWDDIKDWFKKKFKKKETKKKINTSGNKELKQPLISFTSQKYHIL